MLDMRETLLLGRRQNAPVLNQTGGRIVEGGIDSQGVHRLSPLTGWGTVPFLQQPFSLIVRPTKPPAGASFFPPSRGRGRREPRFPATLDADSGDAPRDRRS